MNKIVNIFFFIIILIFFLSTYKFYSSNKTYDAKEFNRINIDKIIETKITNLPILNNDTNNVIEFNDGYSNEIKNDKTRSFWNLLKISMKRKAIIISIKGLKLTSKEKLLLSKEKPWGLILFKRNIKSLIQTKKLIKTIRNCVKDKKFPILIDEEGSKVSRLRSIINHNINANYFGNLYKINKKML